MGEFDLNHAGLNVLRWAGVGVAAIVLTGCASDTSRLAVGVDHTPTASIASGQLIPPEAIGQSAAAPPAASSWSSGSGNPAPSSAAIQSAPLAPVSAPSMPTRPSYQAAPIPARPASTPAIPSSGGSFGPWTTAGGAPVTVGANESASVIAARYGVPQEALLRSNGLTSAAQVRPGMQLTVPVYDASLRAAPPSAAPASAAPARTPAPQRQSAANPASNPAPAATLQSQAATQQQRSAALAPASSAPASRPTDGARPASAGEAAKPQPAARPAATARPEHARTAAVAPKPEPEAPKATAPAADDKPEFRWPARGRIIQGFKSGASDGIAIAVPEGTAVKAAEAGVVAYAGNELKGYGNLVLIRHPNGFVSAYAHNGELNVKRGDTVRRGQVIAKSGQSGNVSSPQLHFELRKGSTPVDPTAYLAGL